MADLLGRVRILMVHPGVDFSVADVHDGWFEAFKSLGVNVASVNLQHRLAFYAEAGRLDTSGEFRTLLSPDGAARLCAKGIEAACFEMWPDVVFVTSAFYIPPDTLDMIRARGMKVVILMTEQPYESVRELALAEHADLVLLNDPTHLDRFAQITPTRYMPHAYRPSIHHPGPVIPALTSDFVFIGTGFPSRVAFFEQVDWTGVDVALGGMWQTLHPDSPLRKFVGHDIEACMDNTDTADAYRSSQIGANLYRTEGDRAVTAGWSLSPREVEMAACGLFYLREAGRTEGDRVLDMLPRFPDPDEFTELLRWYLARPDTRRALADAARVAIADRTFEANARTLLGVLENL